MSLTQTAYRPAGQECQDREHLILQHLPQVRWIASRIHEKLPIGYPLEDLVSVGILGLISAIDHFDNSLNVQLKTYAEYRIRGAILDSIRGIDGIPEHKRKKAKQIQAAIRAAQQKCGHNPTEEDIAAELGVSVAVYQEYLCDVHAVTTHSLDAATPGDENLRFSDITPDRAENLPDRQLQQAQLAELLGKGIRQLPETERVVLDLYFRQERTLREIGLIMNLHLSRIAQLKTQGVLRLRNYIGLHWKTSKGLER